MMLTTSQTAEKLEVKMVTVRSYIARELFPSATKFRRDW